VGREVIGGRTRQAVPVHGRVQIAVVALIPGVFIGGNEGTILAVCKNADANFIDHAVGSAVID
jgi:hypothetical protein